MPSSHQFYLPFYTDLERHYLKSSVAGEAEGQEVIRFIWSHIVRVGMWAWLIVTSMRPKKSPVRVVIFCNQAKNGDLGMLPIKSVVCTVILCSKPISDSTGLSSSAHHTWFPDTETVWPNASSQHFFFTLGAEILSVEPLKSFLVLLTHCHLSSLPPCCLTQWQSLPLGWTCHSSPYLFLKNVGLSKVFRKSF